MKFIGQQNLEDLKARQIIASGNENLSVVKRIATETLSTNEELNDNNKIIEQVECDSAITNEVLNAASNSFF